MYMFVSRFYAVPLFLLAFLSALDPGASRRVRALLHENKAEATRVEVTTIGDNLSNTDTARHYRTRAETLESAFSGPETVHAVLFVLTRDIQEAERAIENTSSSGADLLHRDALSRYARAFFKMIHLR